MQQRFLPETESIGIWDAAKQIFRQKISIAGKYCLDVSLKIMGVSGFREVLRCRDFLCKFLEKQSLLTDKNYKISRSARTCPDRSVRNNKAYSGFRRLLGSRRHCPRLPNNLNN